MSIWTRIADALSALARGEPLSVVFDRLRGSPAPERSVGFTIAVLALGAKMAKADGVVTEDEITAFKQVFHIPEAELSAVARVFNMAKKDTAGFETYARQIAGLFGTDKTVLEDVIDGLFHIAKADNALHPGEHGFLAKVAEIFGFGPADFARIRARHVAVADDPYLILGIDRAKTVEEIKARYRVLVREYHPDRHIAAGVPEEMIEIATARLQTINEAYEKIMREKGA